MVIAVRASKHLKQALETLARSAVSKPAFHGERLGPAYRIEFRGPAKKECCLAVTMLTATGLAPAYGWVLPPYSHTRGPHGVPGGPFFWLFTEFRDAAARPATRHSVAAAAVMRAATLARTTHA
jgi:hypothetical protein